MNEIERSLGSFKPSRLLYDRPFLFFSTVHFEPGPFVLEMALFGNKYFFESHIFRCLLFGYITEKSRNPTR